MELCHTTSASPGRGRFIPLVLVAICCLLAALGLASFSGEQESTVIDVSLESRAAQAVWESGDEFSTLRSEGEFLVAGDTLGWALEGRLWNLLSSWAGGADPADMTAEQVVRTLEEIGLASRIPEVVQAGRGSGPPHDGKSEFDARTLRLEVDSLELALHHLRRQWRMTDEGPSRERWAEAIRDTEAALNRARATRDRRIQREERGDRPSGSAGKAEVRVRTLRELADSLLSARVLLAPGSGRMERIGSVANLPGTWRLISSESGYAWMIADVAWSDLVEPGQQWTLRHAEGYPELRVRIDECFPQGCRIRLPQGAVNLPVGKGWILEWTQEGGSRSLLRRWMGWRPAIQG